MEEQEEGFSRSLTLGEKNWLVQFSVKRFRMILC